jgi:hypothetical protein
MDFSKAGLDAIDLFRAARGPIHTVQVGLLDGWMLETGKF